MAMPYANMRDDGEGPKTQPILEGQAADFRNRSDEISKLTSRLNEIANRTFGREASDISDSMKAAPTPEPDCTLAKLTDSGAQLDRAISGLGRAIERFNSL